MDAGALAQMANNGYGAPGLGAPGPGFASRTRVNSKRSSVALPTKINPVGENQVDVPAPRTSRSHLLAGLRTQKGSSGPASAPYNQTQHQTGLNGSEWADAGYNAYIQPHNAGNAYSSNQFGMNAGQQMYSLPEQVLAPPSIYGQDEEMDPNMLEQLQMTGLFLAQRQQQLQQQLANITAAANQFQGLNLNTPVRQQQQYHQSPMTPLTPQDMYAQSPIHVPGQSGVYLVYNPATGQYQYAMDNSGAKQHSQRTFSPATQTRTPLSKLPSSSAKYNLNLSTPMFRAEISPPPTEKSTPVNVRSITPPKSTPSPGSALEDFEPLPAPSATAFRRGHKKASSLAFASINTTTPEPIRTASVSTGSARSGLPPTPMSGQFGPGAARAGTHPIRQPRGPPNLEELIALPTSRHEGSKNFATRQRRHALASLMRADTVRRASGTPVSESELSFASEEDEPGCGRKMSPIGSERNGKRISQGSWDGLGTGSAVQTPASEDGNSFEFRNFVKQLPSPVVQGQERRKAMLGVLNAAEKRKTSLF